MYKCVRLGFWFSLSNLHSEPQFQELLAAAVALQPTLETHSLLLNFFGFRWALVKVKLRGLI